MLIYILIIIAIIGISYYVVEKVNDNNSKYFDKKPQEKTEEQRLKELNKKVFWGVFRLSDKGEAGENLIELTLLEIHTYKKIIRNAYIPYKDRTSEIDLIFITEYGIYVIESKNYSGWIFGSENNKNWTCTLNKHTKNQFYNPILQNRTHINALSKYLNIEKWKFHSVIVFGNNSTLKKVPQDTETYTITTEEYLVDFIYYEIENKQKIFTEAEIERIYNILIKRTQVTQDIKQQHIENAMKYK